ncbi:hypothetical protein F7725_001350, partial [Dissostichus mawsoni]
MALLSSSLTRFCCLRTNRINNGLYSPYLPCQYRLYSTSQVRRGLGRYVQMVNSKYESFLKTRFLASSSSITLLWKVRSSLTPTSFKGPLSYSFPTREGPTFAIFVTLTAISLFFPHISYHQLSHYRIKLLFRDCKEVKRIKENMYSDKLQDVGKAVPLLVISIPPFANYLQLEFQGVSHSVRVQQHQPVLSGLQNLKVQNGVTPQVSEILAVRNLFSGPPLGVKRMSNKQMRLVSPLLFLTPRLPSFLMSRRLQRHGSELLHLDRALSRLGVQNLSEAELRQCREWMSRWLHLSNALK